MILHFDKDACEAAEGVARGKHYVGGAAPPSNLIFLRFHQKSFCRVFIFLREAVGEAADRV